MVKYIETKKGYYYKEYKTKQKKRISKTEYIKHKRKLSSSSSSKVKNRGYVNIGQIVYTLTNLYNTDFKKLCREYSILNQYYSQCEQTRNNNEPLTSCTMYARVIFIILSGNDPSDDPTENKNINIFWIDRAQPRNLYYLNIEPNVIYQIDIWYSREEDNDENEDVYHSCLFHKINEHGEDVALWQAYGDDEYCEKPRHIININNTLLQEILTEMVYGIEYSKVLQLYKSLFQRRLERGISISSVSITYSRIK